MSVLPVGIGSSGDYEISRSVRFRSSATAYFNRTPAVAGSQTRWTWNAWVKRGILSTTQTMFHAGSSTANETMIMFDGDKLRLYNDAASVANMNVETTALHRDSAAWYMFTVVYDSAQATSTNRVLMYVNGVQVTSFASTTYPALNQTTVLNSVIATAIGQRRPAGDLIFDG